MKNPDITVAKILKAKYFPKNGGTPLVSLGVTSNNRYRLYQREDTSEWGTRKEAFPLNQDIGYGLQK